MGHVNAPAPYPRCMIKVLEGLLYNGLLQYIDDTLLDDIGQPVHMFWEAYDYTSFGLAAPARGSAVGDTAGHQSRNYVIADFEAARITMALKIRAIGHDLLDDLVESGDLDATLRSETMTLAGTVLEWTPETGVPSGDLTCVQ